MNRWCLTTIILALTLLTGCAKPPAPYDYTAFRQAKPRSILVPPPVNNSPEVNAGHGVLAQIALPLAESGYYVFPVAVVEETFLHNGLTDPQEIRQVSLEKLYTIFRADAVLYLDIKEYGTKYMVLASDTRVTLEAKLVDLKTGQQLWNGMATASSAEQQSSSNSGLVGMLVQAVAEQIVNTIADRSYDIAGMADSRLLWAGRPNGMLYGPRSPLYGKEPPAPQ
jgi:hypothetical protein